MYSYFLHMISKLVKILLHIMLKIRQSNLFQGRQYVDARKSYESLHKQMDSGKCIGIFIRNIFETLSRHKLIKIFFIS